VPWKRARRAAKKAPKPLRVKLPMGEDATLARGALVYGMAGGTAEERRRLIEVARELREAPGGWVDAIEETLNQVFIPADADLLSFGNGANDNIDLRRTGRGVPVLRAARGADQLSAARGADQGRAGPSARAGEREGGGGARAAGALAGVPAAPVAPLRGAARVPRRVEGWRRVRARRALEGRGARVARAVDTCVGVEDTENKKQKRV
jgi:hypothetical protein